MRVGDDTWHGTILNYSDGGVYVASNHVVDAGTKLRLRFRRPLSGRVADVDGIVLRVVPLGNPTEHQPGFSIQFVELLSGAPSALGASGVFPAIDGPHTGFTPERTKPPVVEQISSTDVDPVQPRQERSAPRNPGISARSRIWSRARKPDNRFLLARLNKAITELEVTFTPHSGSSLPLPAKAINLSKGSMYLAMDELPERDTVLTVRLEGDDVDGKDETLEVVVQVSWSSRTRPHAMLPRGVGCRIVGFHNNQGRKRYEGMLRSLLLIGNPIFNLT